MLGMNRLWDAFVNPMPIAGVPLRWFKTVTVWLNGMSIVNGRIERTAQGIVIYPNTDGPQNTSGADFSFRTVAGGSNEASMTPGDVMLGPDTEIAWGSITNASTTVTVGDGADTWYVWLVVDASDETESAEWYEGSSITSLSSEEQKTKMIVKLVKITADGATPAVITGVKHLQCGDVFIPRL